jgi:hypothetical protein
MNMSMEQYATKPMKKPNILLNIDMINAEYDNNEWMNDIYFLIYNYKIFMVSVLGVLAAAATGSIAFRKLYEYYWKHPNVVKCFIVDISS